MYLPSRLRLSYIFNRFKWLKINYLPNRPKWLRLGYLLSGPRWFILCNYRINFNSFEVWLPT